jgi:hypothetical protein
MNVYKVQRKDGRFVCNGGYGDNSAGHVFTKKNTVSVQVNDCSPEQFDVVEYEYAYVLLVKYLDATNFEGVKVMVYTGKFPGVSRINRLDPHFCESGISPITRFRPDNDGKFLACELAAKLSERKGKS